VEPDSDQQRVIRCADPTIRVVAPAGSGKTGTIVERVVAQVRRGADPRRILVLTFDTSAAGTLADRIAERGSKETRSLAGVRVSTLNAFGYRLLRRHVPAEHRPVVSGDEREAIAAEVRHALARRSTAHDEAVPPGDGRAWSELFSRLKNALHDPRSFDIRSLAVTLVRGEPELFECAGRRGTARAVEAVAWLFTAYDRALALHGRIDFDDQKLRAWQLLLASRDLRRRQERRWAEVVVDEFQDINRLDFELVRVLAARARWIVTGDDDQAIYAFRGCSPEWIIELERRSGRRVTSLELRTNYRNPPNLIDAAVRLIRRNRRRISKRPLARRDDAALIRVVSFPSVAGQAEGIAQAILSARRRASRRGFGDFAVLYRTNVESRPILAALTAAGIPCVVREDPDEETGWRRPPAPRARGAAAAADAVSLLTYFRAKGLQWPVVFLVSCNEGLSPHRRAEVEDERRLFYVAMTRASAELHVSYLDPSGGAHPPASRFLEEAGLGR
jgi:DNA helicase-2/ATP-dependent DNA helicase PcrA